MYESFQSKPARRMAQAHATGHKAWSGRHKGNARRMTQLSKEREREIVRRPKATKGLSPAGICQQVNTPYTSSHLLICVQSSRAHPSTQQLRGPEPWQTSTAEIPPTPTIQHYAYPPSVPAWEDMPAHLHVRTSPGLYRIARHTTN
jgi:hypothetical protein